MASKALVAGCLAACSATNVQQALPHPISITQPTELHPASIALQPGHASSHVFLVAIEARHSGRDPGTYSRGGVLEKNVTLAIADELAADMNAQPRLRAILIRQGDYFIPLNTRAAMARRSGANLFVSLHANASPDHKMHGSASARSTARVNAHLPLQTSGKKPR